MTVKYIYHIHNFSQTIIHLVASSTGCVGVTLEGEQHLLKSGLVAELTLDTLARSINKLENSIPSGASNVVITLLQEPSLGLTHFLNGLVLLGRVVLVKVVNSGIGLLASLLALGLALLISSLNLKCLALSPLSLNRKEKKNWVSNNEASYDLICGNTYRIASESSNDNC